MSLFFNTANGLWTHCFHSLSLSYLSYLASISTAQMGRGRIQLKRIENNINRQVTFSKRRSGLMKKAHEISVLCDVEVAVIIFSTKGKLYEYSTDSSMEKILDRYERFCYAGKDLTEASLLQSDGEAWCLQYHKLKRKAESLQKNERNLIGEDLDSLTAKELHNLELRVEDGLRKIKAQKNNVLFDSIADLKIKEKMLQQQNSAMERKLKSERAAAAAAVATARTLQREQVKQQRLKSTSSVVPNLNIGYLI
ncbi:hypothetical protein ZOSMA_54G00160 [Zostera marina]|uniref:Uncharacterized protein n=1 Tax=Zostera marina TaxID=29655 RepID=A0A0K9NYK8_ZOSMR|nr:hypothetical protein ZOSMA_54G00160 [Zostera marina]